LAKKINKSKNPSLKMAGPRGRGRGRGIWVQQGISHHQDNMFSSTTTSGFGSWVSFGDEKSISGFGSNGGFGSASSIPKHIKKFISVLPDHSPAILETDFDTSINNVEFHHFFANICPDLFKLQHNYSEEVLLAFRTLLYSGKIISSKN
jgi:hypothetical protein